MISLHRDIIDENLLITAMESKTLNQFEFSLHLIEPVIKYINKWQDEDAHFKPLACIDAPETCKSIIFTFSDIDKWTRLLTHLKSCRNRLAKKLEEFKKTNMEQNISHETFNLTTLLGRCWNACQPK